MESQTQTIRSELVSPNAASPRGALLVHIYPTGPEMGTRHTLGARPMIMGRGEGCDIRIEDHSVSRRHATITPCEDGYALLDLGSTNGTSLNDVPVRRAQLNDGDYVRIGNCIYRFLMGGNVEAEYHEEIYRLTIIDALTGIPNKRHFLECLERELARSHRYDRPLTLILFDIDHFKTINDTWGHLAGDQILRDLARSVQSCIRKDELFARYGGEEFGLALPETAQEEALAFAERLRQHVENHPFEMENQTIPVTISVGVASISATQTPSSHDLIAQADKALYQAKSRGRNRVCVASGFDRSENPIGLSAAVGQESRPTRTGCPTPLM